MNEHVNTYHAQPVAVQPVAVVVPITVYVVATVGLAVKVAPVVALNPVPGDQVYVFAPVAVKVVLLPVHIDTSGPAFTTGNGFTVTVTWSVLTHPLASVPVTVYVTTPTGGVKGCPSINPLSQE